MKAKSFTGQAIRSDADSHRHPTSILSSSRLRPSVSAFLKQISRNNLFFKINCFNFVLRIQICFKRDQTYEKSKGKNDPLPQKELDESRYYRYPAFYCIQERL